MSRALLRVAETITLPILLFVGWWLLSRNSTSLFFPPLSDIISALRDWLPHGFADDVIPSVRNLALGYGIAVLVGVGVGLALGLMRWFETTTSLIVHFLRAIPPPAILPLFILVFGTGASMKVYVIAFGSVWPILLATTDGVRGVSNSLLDTARVFSVAGWRRITKVILPAAAPLIFAGLRTALSVAIILIVISEMVASTEGIGFFVLSSQRFFATPAMWAGIIFLGVLGFVLSAAMAYVERRVIKWEEGSVS